MKIFRNLALMALSALMLCACSNSDSEPAPTPNPEPEGPDYLVMMYAAGCGDLDDGIIGNIMQTLDEGSSDKVKMTFEYKLSRRLQTEPAFESFDGTRRFTADDNAHLKGKFQSLSSDYPLLDEKEIDNCTSQLKTERFADADYNITCSEGLADFIKWSKEKYPNAKRTVLIINDHGTAWNLANDGKKDTRAIIVDDNNDSEQLTLNDIIDGVNTACEGGIDLLYTDACVMSTYENLYGYAKCAKYLIASYETAPGWGGDYRELMKLLKNADTDLASLGNAMKKFIDYTVSDKWWLNFYADDVRDIALYDLSRVGEMTGVLKDIASTMAQTFVSQESIEPTVEAPYGDKYMPYIREAALNCLVSYVTEHVDVDNLPQIMVEYMQRDGVEVHDDDYIFYGDIVDWVRYCDSDNAMDALINHTEDWAKVRFIVSQSVVGTYSLTDMLRILDEELTDIGAKNPFHDLRSRLLTALRSVGYIKCTREIESDEIDTAYELCSPGLLLLPLSELYGEDVTVNPQIMYVPDYRDALRYYQNTEFDKQVGWSKFLQVLNVFPSPMTNIMREHFGVTQAPEGEVRRNKET